MLAQPCEIQRVDIMQKESLWVVVETYEVLNGALAWERTVIMSGHLVGIAPTHHVANRNILQGRSQGLGPPSVTLDRAVARLGKGYRLAVLLACQGQHLQVGCKYIGVVCQGRGVAFLGMTIVVDTHYIHYIIARITGHIQAAVG